MEYINSITPLYWIFCERSAYKVSLLFIEFSAKKVHNLKVLLFYAEVFSIQLSVFFLSTQTPVTESRRRRHAHASISKMDMHHGKNEKANRWIAGRTSVRTVNRRTSVWKETIIKDSKLHIALTTALYK